MEKLLTTQDVCGILSLTDRTIRQMIRDGRLNAYKIEGNGRKLLFKEAEISAKLKPVPVIHQVAHPV